MRQTYRAIPRDYEEAAMLDGAGIFALIRHVLVPLARPGLVAFAIVSVTAHWNEFLWPLMAASSPGHQVLTVGLASFASSGEAGAQWGMIASGTVLVAGPLLIAFILFQRRFVSSFVFSGIK
jgi:sn-glycerol 3-phosphate transport system permease protein